MDLVKSTGKTHIYDNGVVCGTKLSKIRSVNAPYPTCKYCLQMSKYWPEYDKDYAIPERYWARFGKAGAGIVLLDLKQDNKVLSKIHIRDLFNDAYSFASWFVTRGYKRFATIYKGTRQVQCEKMRYRSLGDLFCLVKNYYPDANLLRLKLALISNPEVGGWWCPTVKKRVYNDGARMYIFGPHAKIDEFGLPIDWR